MSTSIKGEFQCQQLNGTSRSSYNCWKFCFIVVLGFGGIPWFKIVIRDCFENLHVSESFITYKHLNITAITHVNVTNRFGNGLLSKLCAILFYFTFWKFLIGTISPLQENIVIGHLGWMDMDCFYRLLPWSLSKLPNSGHAKFILNSGWLFTTASVWKHSCLSILV